MSAANRFACKRDNKGKFIKTKKFEQKKNVLEAIQRRTIKLRHQQALQNTPAAQHQAGIRAVLSKKISLGGGSAKFSGAPPPRF